MGAPSLCPTRMSLFRQGSQFMMIGALQLAVDCGIFIAATAAGMPAVPANLLGRIGGAMLGFWLNGRYTFAQQGDARLGWQRFCRFALMWLALTVISTWAALDHGKPTRATSGVAGKTAGRRRPGDRVVLSGPACGVSLIGSMRRQ